MKNERELDRTFYKKISTEKEIIKHFRDAEYKKASGVCRSMLKEDERDIFLLFMQGCSYIERGMYNSARSAFGKIKNYIGVDDSEDAKKGINRCIEKLAQNKALELLNSHDNFQGIEISIFKECFTNFIDIKIKECAKKQELYHNLEDFRSLIKQGTNHYRQEKYEEAVNFYKKAISIYTNNVFAQQTEQNFNNTEFLIGKFSKCHEKIVLSYLKLEKYEDALKSAFHAMDFYSNTLGDYPRAIKLYKTLIHEVPDNKIDELRSANHWQSVISLVASCYNVKALYHSESKEYIDAARCFTQEYNLKKDIGLDAQLHNVENYQKHLKNLLSKENIKEKSWRNIEVIECCKAIINAQKILIDSELKYICYKELGNAYSRLNEYNNAIKAYQDAINLCSDSESGIRESNLKIIELKIKLGEVSENNGYYKESNEYYKQAIDWYHGIDRTIGNKKITKELQEKLGDTYCNIGEHKNAIREYQNAINLHEDGDSKTELQEKLGDTYFFLKDYNLAIESYKKLADHYRTKEKLARSYEKLGDDYLESEKYDCAFREYQNAIDFYKEGRDKAKVQEKVGAIYYDQGKYKDYTKFYGDALKSYFELGQYEEVKRIYYGCASNADEINDLHKKAQENIETSESKADKFLLKKEKEKDIPNSPDEYAMDFMRRGNTLFDNDQYFKAFNMYKNAFRYYEMACKKEFQEEHEEAQSRLKKAELGLQQAQQTYQAKLGQDPWNVWDEAVTVKNCQIAYENALFGLETSKKWTASEAKHLVLAWCDYRAGKSIYYYGLEIQSDDKLKESIKYLDKVIGSYSNYNQEKKYSDIIAECKTLIGNAKKLIKLYNLDLEEILHQVDLDNSELLDDEYLLLNMDKDDTKYKSRILNYSVVNISDKDQSVQSHSPNNVEKRSLVLNEINQPHSLDIGKINNQFSLNEIDDVLLPSMSYDHDNSSDGEIMQILGVVALVVISAVILF